MRKRRGRVSVVPPPAPASYCLRCLDVSRTSSARKAWRKVCGACRWPGIRISCPAVLGDRSVRKAGTLRFAFVRTCRSPTSQPPSGLADGSPDDDDASDRRMPSCRRSADFNIKTTLYNSTHKTRRRRRPRLAGHGSCQQRRRLPPTPLGRRGRGTGSFRVACGKPALGADRTLSLHVLK